MSHRIAVFAVASGLVLTSMAAPAGAHVGTAGTYSCRLSATKLGARIQVTFRLRSSDADREWRVRMWDGGVKFADRTRITNDLGRLARRGRREEPSGGRRDRGDRPRPGHGRSVPDRTVDLAA